MFNFVQFLLELVGHNRDFTWMLELIGHNRDHTWVIQVIRSIPSTLF